MTVQKRKDLLFKVDNDGAGSFATVAAMRSEGDAAWDVRFFPASLLIDDTVRTRASFARCSR